MSEAKGLIFDINENEIMSHIEVCNICNLKDNCPCLEDEMCPYSDNECIKMWLQSEVKEMEPIGRKDR